MLTPLTDMFVGVAEAHGRYLVEQERFPAAKVSVIANGIDTDRFRPRDADPELRRRLGLRPGPVAGTVARLGPEKNHEMFLEVAARTRQEVPDAQFLLIGDGPLGDNLRQRARRLGLAECVHFLGLRSDVAELLGLLNVFLLTSHIEANPISILEALATGVPVVSTRVGSVPETVRADAGFLVEPGDAAAMAARLVQLFRDPKLAQTMGLAGRESVIRRWSVDQMVRQYENVIEQIYRHKRLLQAERLPAGRTMPVDLEPAEERVVCP
jgi:glycosyltransferase involved in cell wall biosynthesis